MAYTLNNMKLVFKKKIKKVVTKNKVLLCIAKSILSLFRGGFKFKSKNYWEERYIKGGNSGAGSCGRLAKFKAKIVNDFVKKNKINSVIDFGCGDGNQLLLLKIPYYIGIDASVKAIELCKEKFKNDVTKSFFIYDSQNSINHYNLPKVDLTLSLDVIYHLLENKIFNNYMYNLFSSSKKFVIIYSSNTEINKKHQAKHVKHRNFSKWVDNNISDWVLNKIIRNKYSLQEDLEKESFADFYIYKKILTDKNK